jgi:hypothetical protein
VAHWRHRGRPPHLGNVKAAITGTYRRLRRAHAGRHLASDARRFDRRFRLDTMLPRRVHGALRTAPLPDAKLIAS